MNHSFTASQLDTNKCARCHFTEIDHTNRATCEACGNTGTCEILYGNMLLCMDCIDKEKTIQKEHQSPENQAKRLQEHARKVDESIAVRPDFYNAETVSHIDVFKAIDADTSIENKQFAKASFLKARFLDFQQKIFIARQELEQYSSASRAIHDTLNGLANKLRQDERDKLKLADTNYTVEKPKTIKPVGAKKPSTKKWNKADVRDAAAEYKVPIDAVQLICVARNMSPKDAAAMLAKQIHG